MAASKHDNRSGLRAKRRLKVRFGVSETNRTAFTRNLSESGLYLQTNWVFKPGSTLQVEVVFPDRSFVMWGRVIWAKKVPPQLAHVLDCGMGICFVDPPAEWLEFYERWASHKL